jgi:hypothetical protein
MSEIQDAVRLSPMAHLAEAKCVQDDWAGISDWHVRKQRQNRLNQRAYSWYLNTPTRNEEANETIQLTDGLASKWAMKPWQIVTARASQAYSPSRLSQVLLHGTHITKFKMHSWWMAALRIVVVLPRAIHIQKCQVHS